MSQVVKPFGWPAPKPADATSYQLLDAGRVRVNYPSGPVDLHLADIEVVMWGLTPLLRRVAFVTSSVTYEIGGIGMRACGALHAAYRRAKVSRMRGEAAQVAQLNGDWAREFGRDEPSTPSWMERWLAAGAHLLLPDGSEIKFLDDLTPAERAEVRALTGRRDNIEAHWQEHNAKVERRRQMRAILQAQAPALVELAAELRQAFARDEELDGRWQSAWQQRYDALAWPIPDDQDLLIEQPLDVQHAQQTTSRARTDLDVMVAQHNAAVRERRRRQAVQATLEQHWPEVKALWVQWQEHAQPGRDVTAPEWQSWAQRAERLAWPTDADTDLVGAQPADRQPTIMQVAAVAARPELAAREHNLEAAEYRRREQLRVSLTQDWQLYADQKLAWDQLATAERILEAADIRPLRQALELLPWPTERDADITGALDTSHQAVLDVLAVLRDGGEPLLHTHNEWARELVRQRELAADLREHWRPALEAWLQLDQQERYLTVSQVQAWAKTRPSLQQPTDRDGDLLVEALGPELAAAVTAYRAACADPRKWADARNERFVAAELERQRTYFDNAGAFPLTDEQRRAIVADEDNALVIAGAGTGKTATIVGKAAYLISRGLAKPDEILLVTFTKKAAGEIADRVREQPDANVDARTLHSLGFHILETAEGRKPQVIQGLDDPALGMPDLFGRLRDELLDDPAYEQMYRAFHQTLAVKYRSLWEFDSMDDYRRYLAEVELRTLSGALARSYEEVEIANWLTLHGIEFEYEREYEHDTRTDAHNQYRPDFYLTAYGIYIEHWGVDEQGNAAPFMDNARYQEKMQWALALHAQHETTLVETYSWERRDGVLLSNLEAKLSRLGVTIGERAASEALADLNRRGVLSGFLTLVKRFTDVYKLGGHQMDAVRERAKTSDNPNRAGLFLDLYAPILANYERELKARDEIDYTDMLVRSTAAVRGGGFRPPWRYLIVDEFQDIGDEIDLLRALRGAVDGCKVFCVGDDWQSIYRFRGADIDLIRNFDERVGTGLTTKLQTTFRFPDKLADFSSRFIQANPLQTRKDLVAARHATEPAVVLHWHDDSDWPDEWLDDVLGDICERLPIDGAKRSVLLLTRMARRTYKRRFPSAEELEARYPRLNIECLTVHRAKGREADFVVIDRLTSGYLGFPSSMTDDPLLDLVRKPPADSDRDEERRLFYVALTRAREEVWLIASRSKTSEFINELRRDPAYELREFTEAPSDEWPCPTCVDGTLVRRRNRSTNGDFYGCSKFPACDTTRNLCPICQTGIYLPEPDGASRCTHCLTTTKGCPRCPDGTLVPVPKRHGDWFYRCSEHPDCEATESPCPSCNLGLAVRHADGQVACSNPNCGSHTPPDSGPTG